MNNKHLSWYKEINNNFIIASRAYFLHVYLRSEGKLFVAKNGSFLEKEFLSKELSGRKIELDEFVEPLFQPESDATKKDVFCGAYVCWRGS